MDTQTVERKIYCFCIASMFSSDQEYAGSLYPMNYYHEYLFIIGDFAPYLFPMIFSPRYLHVNRSSVINLLFLDVSLVPGQFPDQEKANNLHAYTEPAGGFLELYTCISSIVFVNYINVLAVRLSIVVVSSTVR